MKVKLEGDESKSSGPNTTSSCPNTHRGRADVGGVSSKGEHVSGGGVGKLAVSRP